MNDKKFQNMEMLNNLKGKIDPLTRQLSIQRRCIGTIDSFDRFMAEQFSKNNDNNQNVDSSSTNPYGDHNLDDKTKLLQIKERYEQFHRSFHYLKKRCRRIELKRRPAEDIYNYLYELFDNIDRTANFCDDLMLNNNGINPRDFCHGPNIMEGSSVDNPKKDSIQKSPSPDKKIYICPKEQCGKRYRQTETYIKHIQSHLKTDVDDDQQQRSESNDQPQNDQEEDNKNDIGQIGENDDIDEDFDMIEKILRRATQNKNKNSPKKESQNKKAKKDSDQKPKSSNKSKKNDDSKDSDRKSKSLECSFVGCDYKTNFKSAMDLHMSKHSDERPFECDVCQKKFKKVHALRMHVLVHQNQRFQCPYEGCDAVYSWFFALKKHIRIHNNQAPVHRCDWPGCDYQSYSTELVKKHRTKHTGERKFLCQWPDCGKAYKTGSALYFHVATHKNERKHACTWPGCSYRCNLSSNLRKHIAIHEKKAGKTACGEPRNDGMNNGNNNKKNNTTRVYNNNANNQNPNQTNSMLTGQSTNPSPINPQHLLNTSPLNLMTDQAAAILMPHQNLYLHDGNLHF